MADIFSMTAVVRNPTPDPPGGVTPRLPPGVPPMIDIVYLDTDPHSLRVDLKARVQEVSLSVLKSFGVIAGSPSRADYESQLLNKILEGQAGIFVHGGVQVGKMKSNSFTLFFTGSDLVALSPIPFVRQMPTFAGSRWQDHALINAVASLPVPIDIYAQFNLWDATVGTSKPLPDGMQVTLVDDNLILDSERATVVTSSGEGTVVFNLSDSQVGKKPDLLFEIELGAANPEPNILSDPWRSGVDGHNAENLGVFEDFVGTRLGSNNSPLQFMIGLGFWTDVINVRPSATVQLELKMQGRFAQPLEHAYRHTYVIPQTGETVVTETKVSLDYYGVRVDQLPTGFSGPEDLMRYLRANFNEILIDQDICRFTPSDSVLWADLIVGTVLSIDFGASKSGSVVVSAADQAGFVVNTIYDETDGYHPLGGVRRWGFSENQDGSFTFFTKAADRPYKEPYHMARHLGFARAHSLWQGYQRRLADFVVRGGGIAQILPGFAQRFAWPAVKALYWKDDPANPWIVGPD
jgi:hypothetical protein